MAVQVVVRKNNAGMLEVVDRMGKVLAAFAPTENLDGARALLRQINALTLPGGIPIFDAYLYGGASLWAFHQQRLFLPLLREYMKYQELIRFFAEHPHLFPVFDASAASAGEFVRACGIPCRAKTRHLRALLHAAYRFCTFILAACITLFAALKLLVLRPRVLVYTPDKFHRASGCDFRFHAVYQALRGKNIRTMELFHTLLGREFVKNLFARRRAALYLEGIPTLARFRRNKTRGVDLTPLEARHQSFVRYALGIVDLWSRQSQSRVRFLRHLLRWSGVHVFLGMDDPRFVQEIILACRMNRIPAYGFEHGHLTEYHAGWLNEGIPKERGTPFDTLFVWNEYWKRMLIRFSTYYTEDRVKVGGPLRPLPVYLARTRTAPIRHISELRMLIPYESIAPKREIIPYMARLAAYGATLLYKPRPDVPVAVQLQEYGLSPERTTIIPEINEETLTQFDAVMGVYSTFLNEMLFYEKPVFLFQTSFALGKQLVQSGIARLIFPDFSEEEIKEYVNACPAKQIKETAWPPAPHISQTIQSIFETHL